MNKALIIGKFLPPHKGHLALIHYAKQQFSQIAVLVGALEQEPIPGELRLGWLKKIFQHDSQISVHLTMEDLPQASEPDERVSLVWARYLSKRFPEVTHLVSSEGYGPMVAKGMGITSVEYDPPRIKHPISASQIRKNPWKNWDFLPPEVRPDLVKRILLAGSESTGKSTMAAQLSLYFCTLYVPEVARDLIGEGDFEKHHVAQIPGLHAQAILRALPLARYFLFVDSDWITTDVYSRYYHGMRPPFPQEVKRANHFDLILFFEPDLPWEEDHQRDAIADRQYFRDWFHRLYEETGIPMESVMGQGDKRFLRALEIIGKYFPEGATNQS